jgi:hypothetical protein
MISWAPQSENQSRPSCQRGDSPIARPVNRICTSGSEDFFEDITNSTGERNVEHIAHAWKVDTSSGGVMRINRSPLFEIAFVLVCFDHIANIIENANHGMM